jgi:DNA-binding transcriptional LysR family regulator
VGKVIQPADLGFFSVLAAAGSLGAAARELGITTPAVSKHLALMESRLGVSLVNRTTRRMSLTQEGATYLQYARRILGEIDEMEQSVGVAKETPRGLLRINATLGFGRSQVAPLISRFVKRYPQIEVLLQLSVDPPPLSEDAFDVCIRFGAPPDARVIARRIAPNRRLLCAAPAYLATHGTPQVPEDLSRHACIGIRQGREAYGLWRLSTGDGRDATTTVVKTQASLTTNDGEVAVNWALDGHGVLMRAQWHIERHLTTGRLVQVLPKYFTPDADIHVVYPQRYAKTARVRAFVDFVAATFARGDAAGSG